MKSKKRSIAARKAWRKRENWGKGEKKYMKVLKNRGYEILAFGRGYPDFMIRRKGKISFVEVKTNKDRLEKHQKLVNEKLRKVGFGVKIICYKTATGKFEEIKKW